MSLVKLFSTVDILSVVPSAVFSNILSLSIKELFPSPPVSELPNTSLMPSTSSLIVIYLPFNSSNLPKASPTSFDELPLPVSL